MIQMLLSFQDRFLSMIKRFLLLGFVSALLLFGCVAEKTENAEQPQNVSQPAKTVAPASKTELPSLEQGRYCLYDSKREKMTCNFDAAFWSGNHSFNISPSTIFNMEKCKMTTFIVEPYSGEMPVLFHVLPIDDGLYKIDNESSTRAFDINLENPCTVQKAYVSGKLGEDYCYYNATNKEIACGRKLALLHKGLFYNITAANQPLKLDFCGLAGAIDEEKNETFFLFIWKNRNTIFSLTENQSAAAIGSIFLGQECEG